jgi:hypothetical protein
MVKNGISGLEVKVPASQPRDHKFKLYLCYDYVSLYDNCTGSFLEEDLMNVNNNCKSQSSLDK